MPKQNQEVLARMETLGVLQSDLTREMGVSRRTLWSWFKRPLTAREARRIHEALNQIERRAAH